LIYEKVGLFFNKRVRIESLQVEVEEDLEMKYKIINDDVETVSLGTTPQFLAADRFTIKIDLQVLIIRIYLKNSQY
jgi:hypothetical protein